MPVVGPEGRLLGVVTDRDLALRVLAAGKPATTTVEEIMTEPVVTCAPHEELRTAEQRMSDAA